MSHSKTTDPIITLYGARFLRIPIKTRILEPTDSISDIIREYAIPQMIAGDILTISESPLAITQGRAIPVSEIKVSPLAKLLSHYVAKVPYGIGLGSATSMQCAIEETGQCRIMFAAFIGALGKLCGRKGDFYRIAGMQAALVDAATTSPVPPYNETVIKGPLNPQKVCEELNAEFGFGFAVMDINDIGGSWMIGGSKGVSKHFIEAAMKDNPQGQGDELTPLCIVRKVAADILSAETSATDETSVATATTTDETSVTTKTTTDETSVATKTTTDETSVTTKTTTDETSVATKTTTDETSVATE